MELKLALTAFAVALLNRNSQEDIDSAIDDLNDTLKKEFTPLAPTAATEAPVQVPVQAPAVESPVPTAVTEPPVQDAGSAPTTV